MITSASFRNFKSLHYVDIDFERLTVLVGPNASGKTSILEGLYYLSRLASTSVEEFLIKERPEFNSTGGLQTEYEREIRSPRYFDRLSSFALTPGCLLPPPTAVTWGMICNPSEVEKVWRVDWP